MTRLRSVRGFTMIEVIIVILLSAILASAVVPVILAGVEALHYDQKRNNLVEASRFVMDRIGLEVQGISTPSGGTSVNAAEPDLYDFVSARLDSNPCADGSTPTSRTVAFSTNQANPGELMQSVTTTCNGATQGVSSILASLVDQITFTYYGANGQVLAAPTVGPTTDIEAVRVKLRMRDPDLTGRFEAPYALVGEFRPRNLQHEEEFLP